MANPDDILRAAAARRMAQQPPQLAQNMMAPSIPQSQQLRPIDMFGQALQAGDPQAKKLLSGVQIRTGNDHQATEAAIQHFIDLPYDIDPNNSYQVQTEMAKWSRQSGYNPQQAQKQAAPQPLTPQQLSMQNKANISAGKGGDYFGLQQEDLRNIANLEETEREKTGRGTEFERLTAALNDPTATEEQRALIQQRLSTIARGGMDPEQRAFNTILGKTRGGEFADLESVQADIDITKSQLDLLDNAVAELGTGMQGKIVGQIPAFSTAAQIIESDAIKEALRYVNQTKGAVSDREMAMFRSAAIGRDKNIEFNKNMISIARAILQRKEEQAQFFQEWRGKYGSTNGAYEAFKRYAEENPIFEISGTNIRFNGSVVPKKTTPSGVGMSEDKQRRLQELRAKRDAGTLR